MNWYIENENISQRILLFSYTTDLYTKIDERARMCQLNEISENKKREKQQTDCEC